MSGWVPMGRRVCAHADADGQGMHILDPGEICTYNEDLHEVMYAAEPPEYEPEDDIDGDYLDSLERSALDGPGFYDDPEAA